MTSLAADNALLRQQHETHIQQIHHLRNEFRQYSGNYHHHQLVE
jgi:hypothetical protein